MRTLMQFFNSSRRNQDMQRKHFYIKGADLFKFKNKIVMIIKLVTISEKVSCQFQSLEFLILFHFLESKDEVDC